MDSGSFGPVRPGSGFAEMLMCLLPSVNIPTILSPAALGVMHLVRSSYLFAVPSLLTPWPQFVTQEFLRHNYRR